MNNSHVVRYVSLVVGIMCAIIPVAAHAQALGVDTQSLIRSLEDIVLSLSKEVSVVMARGRVAQTAAAASAVGTGAGSCGTLATGASLAPNQSIVSCNGAYTLVFQGDGNVVLYQSSKLGQPGAPWSTVTNGRTATLFAMQSDGNLVLYNGPTALWGSRSQPGGTYGRAGHLVVGDNGILTVFANDNGAALWSSVPGSLATFASVVAPASPSGLSATCNTSTHVASFVWNAQSDATSYKMHLQDTQTGGTGDYTPSSPNQSVTGLYGSYSWNVSACNSAGCSNVTSGTVLSCVVPTTAVPVALPTASIKADATSLTVGQSTTIRAAFTAGTGDALRNTDIDQVSPGSSAYVNKVSTGLGWGTTAQPTLNYSFTPTTPGTYSFYAFVQTNSYPTWYSIAQPRVDVTVTQAPPPAPTGTIRSSAGTSISVGQSTTITLTGSAGSGDTLQSLYINQSVNGGGQTNVLQSSGSPDVYTFKPTTAGTYTFYGWAYTSSFAPNWYQIPGASITITVAAAPVGQTVDNLNKNDPWTWLLKSICVNTAGKVTSKDPYGGCPVGYTIRKMQSTDPLPYTTVDQGAYMQHDPVPVPGLDGTPLVVDAFDTNPFPLDGVNLLSGWDGWDVYAVKNGWVGALSSRDGGDYSAKYYGPNCDPYSGYLLFPSSNFLSGGTYTTERDFNYWEKNLQSYPGSCDGKNSNTADAYYYDPSVTTTWKYTPTMSFGGTPGYPAKSMDTIVSYIGNASHMEAFYFTREYGLTRWEFWAPTSLNKGVGGICTGATTLTFAGVPFTRADCRDWSDTIASASQQIPLRPVPEVNLLQHAHFDDAGGYVTGVGPNGTWSRGGNSKEGNVINWRLQNSQTSYDINSFIGTLKGLRYLYTDCGGTCSGPNVQEIFQEVPISKFVSGANYGYGADVRAENGTGSFQITLQELDANRNVLWQDTVTDTVNHDNGFTLPYNYVFFTSKFIHKSVHIPVIQGATVVRYYITPLTSNIGYDVLDAWLAPWPTANSTLGS